MRRPVFAPPEQDTPAGGSSIDFYGDLPSAIQYANSHRDAYFSAVSQQSTAKNLLALSLVPLSAAALFVGATSSDRSARDFVLGAGVGGASALGVGYLLYSQPRQHVYIAGMDAMSCLALAYTPLLVTVETKTVLDQALGANLDKTRLKPLSLAMEETRIERARLQESLDRLGETEKARAQALIAAADTALARAEALQVQGERLRRDIELAGARMVGQVDQIGAEINRQVLETEPDLTGVRTILAGAPALAADLRDLGVRPSATGAAPREVEDVVGTAQMVAEDLRGSLTEMAAAMAVVASVIGRIGGADAGIDAQTAACRPQADELGIVLDTDGPLTFTAGRTETRTVVIRGGQGPFTATLPGAPAGLALVGQLLNDRVINIVASNSSQAGTSTLVVTDALNHVARVGITVQGGN